MPSRGLHSLQLLRPAFTLRASSGHSSPFLLDRLMVSSTWLTSTIYQETDTRTDGRRERQTDRRTDRGTAGGTDRQTEGSKKV